MSILFTTPLGMRIDEGLGGTPADLAAARVGLTPGDVIDAVRIGMAGEQASTVRIGQRNYDLIVRLQDDSRNDVQANRLTADRRSPWLAHSAQ